MKELFDELQKMLRENIAGKLEDDKSEEEIAEFALFICNIVEYAMPKIKKEELKIDYNETNIIKITKNIYPTKFIIWLKFQNKAVFIHSSIAISEDFFAEWGIPLYSIKKLASTKYVDLKFSGKGVCATYNNMSSIMSMTTALSNAREEIKEIFLFAKLVELCTEHKSKSSRRWSDTLEDGLNNYLHA